MLTFEVSYLNSTYPKIRMPLLILLVFVSCNCLILFLKVASVRSQKWLSDKEVQEIPCKAKGKENERVKHKIKTLPFDHSKYL